MTNVSETGWILIDEIYKVLYLNNQDSSLFNALFWSRHFAISVPAIRNIFNYLSHPIIDYDSKEVTGYLRFIDDEIIKNRKLIGDMSREDYIEYLEEDYYRRKSIENRKLLEIQKDILQKEYGSGGSEKYFPEENLLWSKLLTEESMIGKDIMDTAEIVDELELMEKEEEAST